VREKKMKNHFKYSILITLFLAATMAISAVFAQVPIGKTVQPVPFESSPTANSKHLNMVATGPASAYDGDLSFFAQIKPAATTSPTGIWFQLATFTTPTPPEPFTPGWVDLKIKYEIPMGSDDMYRIEYQVAPSVTWNVLQPDTTTAFPAPAQIRPFPQIAEPNDGVWDWTDVSNIKVRVWYTKVGSYVIAQMTMNIYEVWATVYPNPLPPSASTALSVMPPVVMGVSANPGLSLTDNMFFVDVYAQGLSGMGAGLWGYQVTIKYDTSIITAIDFWSYWPFVTGAPSGIDDVDGSVSVSYFTFAGDTVGFTGDKTPLTRIYFSVDSAGTSALDLLDNRPTYITELKPVGLPGFTPPLYDGFFSSPSYLSFTGGIFPGGDPTGTIWHEDYPIFSRTWTVQGWIDNGDLTLSPSDQLRIDVGGVVKEYHVDQVTITIHWTFKPPTPGQGKADPEDHLFTEIPPGWDPIGSRWHQIYPDYSRPFTINSHTDNGATGFDPSDQFDFEYDDQPGTVYNAHLDAVTTNILVSEKPAPPPIPEFPLGLGIIMALAPMIPIVYVWQLRKNKPKLLTTQTNPKGLKL
jgi:hypothetical protein